MKRLLLVVLPVAAALACRATPRTHHLGSAPSSAPVGSPPWIVDQFFGWTSFPSESLYVTRNFAAQFGQAPTMGSDLDPGGTVVSRKLVQDSTHAVFATTVQANRVLNEVYTFLVRGTAKNSVWKIDAIRALHFNSAVYTMIDSLKGGLKLPGAPPTLVGILELSLSSDSTIKAYLSAHAEAIAAIADAFQGQKDVAIIDVADTLSKAERNGATVNDPHVGIRRMLQDVFVSAVFRMPQFPGCTFIRIGGFNTRQVGYIYAPEGCTPPVMSSDQFILVDPTDKPRWYEYKAQ